MTPLTPERLAELDALIGRPLWGTTELVEMRKIAPALSAALRAAWAERDTLAARLEKSVELLRPLAATADWDDADPYARAAATFIASEAAK